jgi:hypothetical protein
VIVPSSEFQKMCKDLSSIGSTNIKVVSKNFHIEFIADADGILKRKVAFGENEDSDDDDSDDGETEYHATFSTDQLSRITKLAGLNNTMQIFPASNKLPLLFRSNIGSLGKISIYIKSKELVELESNNFHSDNDSD